MPSPISMSEPMGLPLASKYSCGGYGRSEQMTSLFANRSWSDGTVATIDGAGPGDSLAVCADTEIGPIAARAAIAIPAPMTRASRFMLSLLLIDETALIMQTMRVNRTAARKWSSG